MLASLVALAPARGQRWNDARTRALVEQAIRRRAEQLADTTLVGYQATAHGYVTFLAQLGDQFATPPKVVKADELVDEIYWRAPNLSKQIIHARRDTLLLPTDIQYHTDHLGIVQNNFPDIIRIGDGGDEVRDVAHPLSAAGLAMYDFALGDSLRIGIPGRVIEVYEIKVRPKDDRAPGVVGAIYLDRDGAQVVRMAVNFTRASFLDKQLEDLAIVLENGLVAGRYWLPRRQEIEIRRGGTWMDYPVRGIIRGWWEIADYKIDARLNTLLFSGPEITQRPFDEQRKYPWSGRILDSLPTGVTAVTDADVARVQNEARELVRAQALQRARKATLSARSLSDFVRVDRVEGLALGAGLAQPMGGGFAAAVRGRYGLSDHQPEGRASLGWTTPSGRGLAAFASADFGEAGIVAETSRPANSIAAQEFGSDYTDPYDLRGAGLQAELGEALGLRHRLAADYEWHQPLTVHATPATRSYEPTILATRARGPRAAWDVSRAALPWLLDTRLQLDAGVSLWLADDDASRVVAPPPGASALPRWIGAAGRSDVTRFALDLSLDRALGERHRLVARTIAGAVRASAWLPPEALIYLGGPTTAPGYDFHSLVATSAVSQRLELRTPVPFPSFPLGRFGRSPSRAQLAPWAQLALLRTPDPSAGIAPWVRPGSADAPPSGGYASVGVGLLTLFDLLRFDVARGLRSGQGRWSFSVDITRDFWSIL